MRPEWEDGTSAYTIKKFGVVNRYDLSKEFPAITLRRTAIKSCTNEMLWIWQKKSNNIHDLKSSVWDEWADETGSIGKAYGYQMGVKHKYKEGIGSGRPLSFMTEKQSFFTSYHDKYLCTSGSVRDAFISLCIFDDI